MTALIGRDGPNGTCSGAFPLTEAQAQMLTDVCRDGERTYDGRAAATMRRLRNLGLVTAHLDVELSHTGRRTRDLWTVRPNYVAAFCSWCSGRVTAESRCVRIAANGRLYQFDAEACRTAFDADRRGRA